MQEQIAAALGELAARRGAQREEQRVAGLATEISRARAGEAEERTRLAKVTATRFEMLRGNAPELDVMRITSEAQQRRAEEAALQLDTQRTGRERELKRRYARVQLAELQSELATLQGQLRVSLAAIATLRAELERRRVLAPFDGQIGALSPLSEGSVVQAGASFGVLLPSAPLRVVAEYPPAAALGRVRPGQTAWMRLHGFPFTQYGRLRLRVAHRADEVHEGRVRVELEIDDTQFPVSLSHGLPGSTDIEVESVTPIQLCRRALGRLVASGPAIRN
jgi:membrane fusion protein (multidrug efflux system)